MTTAKFGVYLHVPFCSSKCAYCSFYSAVADGGTRESYVRALIHQLTQVDFGALSPPYTLYFGGGTPSLLPPSFFASVTHILKQRLGCLPMEVTVECNPDVDVACLRELRAAHVTRVSVGVQSMEPRVLELLGRRHRMASDFPAVLRAGQRFGLEVAVDFMAGVPGAPVDQVLRDLASFEFVDHVSVYMLSLEAGHPLSAELDGDFQHDSFSHARDALVARGFEWYEIANFARPGRRSQHNSLYWSGLPYVALGAGAVGFSGSVRYRVPEDLRVFCEQDGLPAVCIEEYIGASELLRERIMLGMRTADGVEGAVLEELYPAWRQKLAGPWAACLEACAQGRWRIAPRFWLNYGDVMGHFFP